MKTIYVVFGQVSAYEENTSWPVMGYTDQEGAFQHAIKAQETGMNLFQHWSCPKCLQKLQNEYHIKDYYYHTGDRDDCDVTRPANEFDENMQVGMLGVKYYVETVQIKQGKE